MDFISSLISSSVMTALAVAFWYTMALLMPGRSCISFVSAKESTSVSCTVTMMSQTSWYFSKYVSAVLIFDIVKKHCITVNAMNENIRDKDAVRRAFRCAFKAFPANSPSVPNKNASTGEFFFRLSCSSPVFLIASSGVSLLNFLAGSQADIQIVITVTSSVKIKTSGW